MQAARCLPRLAQTSTHARLASVAARCTMARWTASAAPTTAQSNGAGVYVNSHFDSGNIEVLDMADAGNMRLAIHKDPYCSTDNAAHAMWFNYRLTGVRDLPLTMHLTNAGHCSFPAAWQGYSACASYDLQHWFRVPTTYDADSGVLSISHTPQADAVQYAYFAPFTYDRHQQLVARMQAKPGVRLHMIGETLDGHDLDMLVLGEAGPAKRSVWIMARQHPGESQAEWFAEGLLERLTDPADAVARHLLRDAVVYVVPNANPDGTWRGHLRTNAAGRNMNRDWAAPCAEESPEVFHLLREMDARGVDLCVDVHGDEELPYVFIAGAEGIPGWSERLAALQTEFSAAFKRASPDFQTQFGYAVDAPGEANMGIATNQIAQRFDCLSVTLEMPFKDNANCPCEVQGWSPERCINLGASLLPAIYEVLPRLRP